MAAKTTSGSGFLSIFEFITLDLVENANNLEKKVPLHFLKNLGSKFKNVKVNFKNYENFHLRIF